MLLSVRDRQTLQWHFKYALEQDRIWILTASEGARLVAYAILERRDVQDLDLTRMFLVDFQTVTNNRNLASGMISFALDRCRREGIHLMENLGCWLEKEQPLVRRAPYHRRLKNWCYFYRATNSELADALNDAESWCATQYDADGSL